MTLVQKIRRAKKAIVSTLGSLTTAILVFAPDFADEYKIGVGVVGTLFTGVLTYLTTNEEDV